MASQGNINYLGWWRGGEFGESAQVALPLIQLSHIGLNLLHGHESINPQETLGNLTV